MTTATTVSHRVKRLAVVDGATHLFALGQTVRLRGGLLPSGNIYRVTAKLPPTGDSPQYRIRNDGEKFDRVATQANLEMVSAAAEGELGSLVDGPLVLGSKAQSQTMLSWKVTVAIRAGAGARQAEQVNLPAQGRGKTTSP